jgi:hypothetical protein
MRRLGVGQESPHPVVAGDAGLEHDGGRHRLGRVALEKAEGEVA